MRYSPEPAYAHGTAAKTAVLLVNLGTPDAPTPAAVRRYLKEFLSDPRVVELPRMLWWPILHGVVLPTRARRSALKYARIWEPEGSPLKLHTERQARLLGELLAERFGAQIAVAYAMRYGRPSIQSVLDRFKNDGCERVLVLPLYPQYSASATAAVFDEVARFVRRTRNVPAIRMVRNFHDHPGYIGALASAVREHWQAAGEPGKLLVSFHGVPRIALERGDPYHCECQKTARLLAETLQLREDQWQIAFQSRFGRAEWLRPYTSAVLHDWGRGGVARADVICPGFVADCLETLEEIGVEGKESYLAAGGREFRLIQCLNERTDWIRALAQIATEHLCGWVDAGWNGDTHRAALEASADRARALGASA